MYSDEFGKKNKACYPPAPIGSRNGVFGGGLGGQGPEQPGDVHPQGTPKRLRGRS
jgi:hypothetical protein